MYNHLLKQIVVLSSATQHSICRIRMERGVRRVLTLDSTCLPCYASKNVFYSAMTIGCAIGYRNECYFPHFPTQSEGVAYRLADLNICAKLIIYIMKILYLALILSVIYLCNR